MSQLNGVDLDDSRAYITAVIQDPSKADRDPAVLARWVGADRAEVSFASGAGAIYVGGTGEPSAMTVLLAALAACDVDLVANRAAMLGVEIEELSVATSGHFNVRRYLGLEAPQGPGYQRIAYVVRLKARAATSEQLAALRRACERDSPVGDTLREGVTLSFEFEPS
jgi:uncharacterized OsmC-like protein